MTVLEDWELERYRRAAYAVRQVLKYLLNHFQPDTPYLQLCEQLENLIREYGAEPAFPVNVSVYSVAAHYTAAPQDERAVGGTLVKVDVGAHVDGYIVDAAVTINLDPRYDQLVKAALRALEAVLHSIRVGTSLGYLGSIIEREIRSLGFRPVENLTGHLIARYRLHAGKAVPNISVPTMEKVRCGEVYAIEPFATEGRGRVREGSVVEIFSIELLPKKVKKVRSELRTLVEQVVQRYRTLPFARRWLIRDFSLTEEGARELLTELQRRGLLNQYPVLEEVSGLGVSQFEDTVIVFEDHVEPLVGTVELVR